MKSLIDSIDIAQVSAIIFTAVVGVLFTYIGFRLQEKYKEIKAMQKEEEQKLLEEARIREDAEKRTLDDEEKLSQEKRVKEEIEKKAIYEKWVLGKTAPQTPEESIARLRAIGYIINVFLFILMSTMVISIGIAISRIFDSDEITPTPALTLTSTPTKTPTLELIPTQTIQSTILAPQITSSPTITPTPLPSSIVDTLGVQMNLVPAGSFQMGDGTPSAGQYPNVPIHSVFLDAYYIDIYEVTNSQYATCVNEGVCTHLKTEELFTNSFAQYPVRNVSWFDALTFCEWRGATLPTEAQWEKVAKSKSGGLWYPWGDAIPNCTIGAFAGAQFDACPGQTAPVGSFASNGSGTFDLAGNVAEWVFDWYDPFYYSSQSNWINPLGPEDGTARVVRGGSWRAEGLQILPPYEYYITDFEVYRRGVKNPNETFDDVGFRCARVP